MKRVVLVALLLLYGASRSAPQMLPASPTPLVAVLPATPANLPKFDEATVQRFHPFSFILANNADKAVVGVYIRWSYIDANDGHTVVNDLATDSYKVPHFNPVIPAHDRLLVAPGALVLESFAANLAANSNVPHMGGSGGGIDAMDGHNNRSLAAGMPGVAVKIETVIFDDGEVYGPNEVAYDTEIRNRLLVGGPKGVIVSDQKLSEGEAWADSESSWIPSMSWRNAKTSVSPLSLPKCSNCASVGRLLRSSPVRERMD